MSVQNPAPIRSFRPFWPVLAPVVIAFAYVCAHLGWYMSTPLGRVPVLDERENLSLAEAIVQHALPAEPFYRAPGYALVLAGFREMGTPAPALFSAALFLGALLHALNAGLIAAIANRWFGRRGAWSAGILYALHPVFIHYATQALDATPSLTLFLAGLCAIARTLRTRLDFDPGATTPVRPWIVASLCWAAATLMRPNYLFVWITLPLLAWWIPRNPRPLRAVAAALAGAVLFVLTAGWQHQISGVAGFLPWQGAYNLWAANQPGAHGRYYEQRISLPAELAASNPARAESVILYRQETGQTLAGISAMNAYWRSRFLNDISHHPGAWLGQMAHKAYALVNDWDQYNNKTFAFHQARSPWLRWNPLSWGILFVLGLAGAARLAAEAPRTAAAVACVGGAYAISVWLFFVSGRFRLPLEALAIVLSGGALATPGFWRSWPGARSWILAGALVLGGLLTFSSFDRVRDKATFVQDHALLARAAATTGDDELSWSESLETLALQPAHPDAMRLAVAAYFNELLNGAAPASEEKKWAEISRRFLATPATAAADLHAVAALALWRAGERSPALAVWRELGATPSALAARLLAHDETVGSSPLSSVPASAWSEPLVRLAAATLDLPSPPGVTLDARIHSEALAQKLFADVPGTPIAP